MMGVIDELVKSLATDELEAAELATDLAAELAAKLTVTLAVTLAVVTRVTTLSSLKSRGCE